MACNIGKSHKLCQGDDDEAEPDNLQSQVTRSTSKYGLCILTGINGSRVRRSCSRTSIEASSRLPGVSSGLRVCNCTRCRCSCVSVCMYDHVCMYACMYNNLSMYICVRRLDSPTNVATGSIVRLQTCGLEPASCRRRLPGATYPSLSSLQGSRVRSSCLPHSVETFWRKWHSSIWVPRAKQLLVHRSEHGMAAAIGPHKDVRVGVVKFERLDLQFRVCGSRSQLQDRIPGRVSVRGCENARERKQLKETEMRNALGRFYVFFYARQSSSHRERERERESMRNRGRAVARGGLPPCPNERKKERESESCLPSSVQSQVEKKTCKFHATTLNSPQRDLHKRNLSLT